MYRLKISSGKTDWMGFIFKRLQQYFDQKTNHTAEKNEPSDLDLEQHGVNANDELFLTLKSKPVLDRTIRVC